MLFSPVVNRLTRWRVPRVLAAGAVLLVLLGTAGTLVDATIDPAREWLNRAPGVLREVERKIRPLQRMAAQFDVVAAHAERVAEGGTAGQRAALPTPSRSGTLLMQTPAVLVTIAGTFFLTFFLLAWGPALLAKIAGGVARSGGGTAVAVSMLGSCRRPRWPAARPSGYCCAGFTSRSLRTDCTPETERATCAACIFSSLVSTNPCNCTTPLRVSTLI